MKKKLKQYHSFYLGEKQFNLPSRKKDNTKHENNQNLNEENEISFMKWLVWSPKIIIRWRQGVIQSAVDER